MKHKVGLPTILFALAPRSLKRGVGLFLALLFAPFLLIVTIQVVGILLEALAPVLWIAGALAVLYGLGRWLFGRRR